MKNFWLLILSFAMVLSFSPVGFADEDDITPGGIIIDSPDTIAPNEPENNGAEPEATPEVAVPNDNAGENNDSSAEDDLKKMLAGDNVSAEFPSDEDVNMDKAYRQITNKLKRINAMKADLAETKYTHLFGMAKMNAVKGKVHKFINANHDLAMFVEQYMVLDRDVTVKTACLAYKHIVDGAQIIYEVNDTRLATPKWWKTKEEEGIKDKLVTFAGTFQENSGTRISHEVAEERGDHAVQKKVRTARAKLTMMCGN